MHPHGVKYNPEYDGVYLGRYTRAGGFVAPGEEFTYTWECVPESVGAWPYHDHGPNHTLNTLRGMFGAIVIREKGDDGAARRGVALPALSSAAGHRPAPLFQCINGRAYAGNTPTIRAQGRPGGRPARLRVRRQLPRLPHPRPPLEGQRRGLRRHTDASVPTRPTPARFARTTPAGGSTTAMSSPTRTPAWPAGTSSSHRRKPTCPIAGPSRIAARRRRRAGRRPGRRRRRLPAAGQSQGGTAKPKGPFHTLKVCKAKKSCFRDDPGGRQRAPSPATRSRSRTAPTARASRSPAPPSATSS